MSKGQGVNWVCEASESRPIPVGGEGLAALKPETVMGMFRERIKRTPERVPIVAPDSRTLIIL